MVHHRETHQGSPGEKRQLIASQTRQAGTQTRCEFEGGASCRGSNRSFLGSPLLYGAHAIQEWRIVGDAEVEGDAEPASYQ